VPVVHVGRTMPLATVAQNLRFTLCCVVSSLRLPLDTLGEGEGAEEDLPTQQLKVMGLVPSKKETPRFGAQEVEKLGR
jgi:hypothetical protein